MNATVLKRSTPLTLFTGGVLELLPFGEGVNFPKRSDIETFHIWATKGMPPSHITAALQFLER